MVKLKHIFCVILIFTLSAAFCISVRAESVLPPDEKPPQEIVPEEAMPGDNLNAVQEFIKIAEENGTEYTVTYTSDSVCTEGVYVDLMYDELRNQIYLQVHVDLPIGYTLYDEPDTEYTDGVKINADFITVNGKYYKIYISDPTVDYTVIVKTTYAESMYGTIAKIQNGDASVLDLFENPVMLMQVVYYAIATVSLIVAAVLTSKSKKYKAKTSQEIAADVAATMNTASNITEQKLVSAVMGILSERLLPAFTNCVNSNQSVVKAIALSNSKSKEAPVALLNLLKEVASNDAVDVISNEIVQTEEAIASEEREIVKTINTLHEIANDNSDITSAPMF